jgi:undecaprenol kinase
MKRATRSLGFALSGLIHAFRHERNLQLFAFGHLMVCGVLLGVARAQSILFILILSLVGGFFIVIELLNTAIERLADTFDDYEKKHRGGHYHPGIKMTKDVGASASLVALFLYGICLLNLLYGLYMITIFSVID